MGVTPLLRWCTAILILPWATLGVAAWPPEDPDPCIRPLTSVHDRVPSCGAQTKSG